MPGAGGSHAAPWGCPTRTQAGGARDLAGHAKGRLLTCGAAHGDNAAAGGAEQGQQPLGELQRTEEVHLHAGAKLAQRRELGIGNGVIEAGVVHQSPKPCRDGMLKEATLMDDTHTHPSPPRDPSYSPAHGGPAGELLGALGQAPLAEAVDTGAYRDTAHSGEHIEAWHCHAGCRLRCREAAWGPQGGVLPRAPTCAVGVGLDVLQDALDVFRLGQVHLQQRQTW